MNIKQIMVLVVAAIFTMTLAGEVLARGGNGAGNGTGARPAGSQRRDGTFLSTGTTANGSTSRPANGSGPRDGSCRTTTTAPAATN